MLCHVCERDAIGQCKNCGKFYCRQHGDVYCVRCGRGGRPRHAEAEPVQVGPTCYACPDPPTGACTRCGRFYCDRHGSRSLFRPAECSACRRWARIWVYGLMLFGVLLLGLFLFIAYSLIHLPMPLR